MLTSVCCSHVSMFVYVNLLLRHWSSPIPNTCHTAWGWGPKRGDMWLERWKGKMLLFVFRRLFALQPPHSQSLSKKLHAHHSSKLLQVEKSTLDFCPFVFPCSMPSFGRDDGLDEFRRFVFFPLQEMLAIMKSIYDMMGRYTYPCVRDEAPYEHVDKFFQVEILYFLNCKCPKLLRTYNLLIFLHWAFSLQKMDKNRDGVVTIEEFIETCQKVSFG